jgi:hypothetical protein
MKKRLLLFTVVLVFLALAPSSALAGGARNATFVKFEQAGVFYPGPYYCEGYYMETGNGIVHGWRENPECVPYQPFITEYKVHMVFKPASRFSEPDCDDKGYITEVGPATGTGPWTLGDSYKELPGDDADLSDIFGEQSFWVCFYEWTED